MRGASEVNNVNQWKDKLNVYAAEKKMIYVKGTKVIASRNKEYLRSSDSPVLFSEEVKMWFPDFIPWYFSSGLCIYAYFFDAVRWKMKLQTENIC